MVKNILLACVLTAAGGYLLGSILFGVLISKVMYNDDVRNHGSGNAGMTNVLRTYGKLPAVFTTLGDVGKSVAAVSLGRFILAHCSPAQVRPGRTRWTPSAARIWPPSSA